MGTVQVRASTGRYPRLTAIRGLAALAVLLTHVAYWTGHYVTPTWGRFLARMDFGVALFFVLSGFLLFRKWVAALANGQRRPSTLRYFLARARRILPAYWVVVIAAFALIPSDRATGTGSLLATLGLAQVYPANGQHQGLTQMWSLAVEAVFYVLLPVLAALLVGILCRGRWRPGRLLAGVAAFGLLTVVWYVVTRTVAVLPVQSVFWPPGYLDWFAGGMALAVLAVAVERREHPRWVSAAGASVGGVATIALALFVIACTPAGGEATLVPLDLFQALTKNLLYLAIALLLVGPLVLADHGGGRATEWLLARPLQWLGEISYEVFLVHVPVLILTLRLLGFRTFTGDLPSVLVITLGVSVALAWLLHRVTSPVTGSARPRWRLDAATADERDGEQRQGLGRADAPVMG